MKWKFKITGEDFIDIVAQRGPNTSTILIEDYESGIGSIESDAKLIILRVDPGNFSVIDFNIFDGTYLLFNEEEL